MFGNIPEKSTLIFILVFVLFMAIGCAKKSSGGGSDENISAIQLAQLINEERTRRGVNVMTWDATIAAVEQAHAQWLADKDPPGPYTYPYNEAGDGGKLFPARLDDAGVTYNEATEYGYATTTLTNAGLVFNQLPDDVFDAKWNKFGIGYVKPPYRESGNQYWIIGLVDD